MTWQIKSDNRKIEILDSRGVLRRSNPFPNSAFVAGIGLRKMTA